MDQFKEKSALIFLSVFPEKDTRTPEEQSWHLPRRLVSASPAHVSAEAAGGVLGFKISQADRVRGPDFKTECLFLAFVHALPLSVPPRPSCV